ncbi:Trp biosynthesis-associated membrane protein [Pseudonocardia endophytica]|uniref:Putative membrane protein (TIGR02234 family) n=1 Tax=Pseudonocardia endophytica TaxID=401976 RepID=A0A4R1HQT6_PSEEN|nr:Trp biosynthesis-associated membrane protein [Pseudonocardia endophytica]TCK24974.1 putative membrane protein (TIGR02234 family) [Pseudonocardia endophytica]
MTAPERDDRRSLAVACVLLLVGAGTAWLSGTVTWFSVQVPSATGGAGAASVTGSQIQPTVTAVAAVLLAAVAATVALSGIARRVLGVLVVLAGVAAGWTTVARLVTPPTPAEIVSARAGLNTAGQPIGTSPVSTGAGAWVAVAAAVLAVAAGVLLVVKERRMARLGARYAAPGSATTPSDPDRAAWEQLDDGDDPTVDRMADPDVDHPVGPAADPSREGRGHDL